jgi:hypothetical protein
VSNYSRRHILLTGSALLTGCSLPRRWDAGAVAPPAHPVAVRAPVTDQWWRYAKRDGLSGKLLESQVERVAEINGSVTIRRHSETEPATSGSEKYFQSPARPPRDLPFEVQEPWGQILVDPHWDLVQVYSTPIPLWPPLLQSDTREVFNVRYRTAAQSGEMAWLQTMIGRGWEKVRVPAGEFTALRYTNEISFTHTDYARWQSVRSETIWLAPEVGRWVARKSSGTYWGTPAPYPINEDFSRWELLEWA